MIAASAGSGSSGTRDDLSGSMPSCAAVRRKARSSPAAERLRPDRRRVANFSPFATQGYRIEDSTVLETWNTVDTGILGSGGMVTRFYSTENQPKRYFQARRE